MTEELKRQATNTRYSGGYKSTVIDQNKKANVLCNQGLDCDKVDCPHRHPNESVTDVLKRFSTNPTTTILKVSKNKAGKVTIEQDFGEGLHPYETLNFTLGMVPYVTHNTQKRKVKWTLEGWERKQSDMDYQRTRDIDEKYIHTQLKEIHRAAEHFRVKTQPNTPDAAACASLYTCILT